ncbi:MAG TPA: sigma-E processing peptidase SpoIIGA [Firmicutes bacterium]|nr:sigma-E processing peptidase SpoIIGA [Bacillota bacterium]
MPVIYLDVLLALNLFIDFLLLTATGRILRLARKRWRLVLGAGVGAASCCLVLVPGLPGPLSLLFKLAAACLIIRVAFRWQGVGAYIKQLLVFLVASSVFAGLAFALWFFAAPEGFYVLDGVVYYNVSPLLLVALTVVSYFALSLYERFTRKRAPEGRDYRLTIDAGAGKAVLRALYDTGHHVTDVFSGSPVAIVRYEALAPCLPEELRQAVHGAMLRVSSAPEGAIEDAAVKSRLRMIPLRTVSGTGLLPAFQPRSAELGTLAGWSADVTGIYLAVCDTLGRGEYDALIGTDIVSLLETGGVTAESRQPAGAAPRPDGRAAQAASPFPVPASAASGDFRSGSRNTSHPTEQLR